MRVGRFIPAAVLVCLLALPSAARSDIITVTAALDAAGGSFAGTFVDDNDVAFIPFEVAVTSTFAASTNSFNPDDPASGFDPLLTLISIAAGATSPVGGTWLAENDDGEPGVNFNAVLLPQLLQPGFYALVLTQAFNTASIAFDSPPDAPVVAGFSFDDWPDYSTAFSIFGGECTGFANMTVDLGGNPVGAPCLAPTFSGTFELTPEQSTQVPEPGTLALVVLGLTAAGLRRRLTG